MKQCSVCDQAIEDGISVCSKCGEHLKVDDPLKVIGTKKPKWYYRNTSWIVGFLVVGPLILPVVWANPRFSILRKTFITSILILITAVLVHWSLKGLNYMDNYYSEILKLYD